MTATALALPHPPHSALPAPAPAPLALASLRTQLQAVVAGGRTAGSPWATHIGPLDAALGGGVPRGRLTEVVGTLGSGKTALLRQVVTGVLQSGGWVAWIDSRRTLAAAPWANLGDRLVVIRPHTETRGAGARGSNRSTWCADLLLRSGVFSLVVIDGAPALSRVHGVRLAQLARERDAACVVLTDDTRTSRISGAVRLRVQRMTIHTATPTTTHTTSCGFSVIVEKGGPTRSLRSVEVHSDIPLARRVCAHSEIPDRRGVARGTRRPWAAVGGDTNNTATNPVTWGGLAVSAHDTIHSVSSSAPVNRHATDAGVIRTDRPPLTDRELPYDREHHPERDREHGSNPERDRDRFNRQFDKHIRNWTKYRGRRRAAESSYGKPGRREKARIRVAQNTHDPVPSTQYSIPRSSTHNSQPSTQSSPLGLLIKSARR